MAFMDMDKGAFMYAKVIGYLLIGVIFLKIL